MERDEEREGGMEGWKDGGKVREEGEERVRGGREMGEGSGGKGRREWWKGEKREGWAAGLFQGVSVFIVMQKTKE